MKKKTSTKAKKQTYLNDFDAYQHALARVNLSEAVTPIVRGKTVEDTDTYNKVQQMLDCPDMEHAHEFLLDVDFDELTPEVVQKVDDLYQLAVEQGFITGKNVGDSEAEETEEENEDAIDDEVPDSETNLGTVENDPEELKNSYVGDASTSPKVAGCAYTLFYSAMKDGKIRSGESYSNATTAENAKADVVKKLQKLGFTAIDILACEECDPDLRGTASTQPQEFGQSVDDVQADVAITEAEEADNAKPDNDKETEKSDTEDETSEDEEEKEEPEDEKKELSRADKIETFKKYLNEFKSLLKQMKAESYADMALADRAKFYAEMAKRWEGRPDPTEFMSDDNVKQIETMRIKID